MTEHVDKGFRRPLLSAAAIAAIAVGIYYALAANNGHSDESTTAQNPPPPQVEIVELAYHQVRLWKRFSGRLTAVDSAEIKPRVSGEIQQVLFADGQQVKQGDELFVIDPRPFEAAVQQAEAQLASARSRATLAQDELERARKLVERQLVSESIYDAAKNEFRVATASIQEAQSTLVEARLNLEYAHIKAPFDGRISRAELTVGNVVEAGGSAPILATLVSNQRLYAEFNVDEQTYIHSMRHQPETGKMPVELTLADDDKVYRGEIHAFDNQLDISTGTIRARAIFDNTDGTLTPGMYANVRLGAPRETEVLLLPSKAIGTNQDKKFVYVVADDNSVSYREVKLGQHHEGQRVVLGGLQSGEQVVVNGLSHVRPGMTVSPIPALTEADSTADAN
ncbi:MAG: efflux RND transporter periplasmic adaptor subunit [Gammaproteobacteria bacterium]|nr:MAG: efflux RND transporter periplasmic adaptor subunit [Gammaproteobacteria bacterium]